MKKTYTCTTSTLSDKDSDNLEKYQKIGYERGYKYAIEKFNDRLMTWLMVGLFTGTALGWFFNSNLLLLVSIILLIHLVEKINKIRDDK